MHPGSDMGGPGFASRRPNASNLPNFELPPPPHSNNQKYQYAISGSQAGQTPGSLASVGNLLTPPSTIGGEGVTSPAGNVSTSSAPSGPPYSNGGFASWSPSAQSHPPYYQQQSNSHQGFQQQRVPYSPASTIVRGHPHSPPASDGGQIPGQAYELPPFPSSTSMSAPSTLPTMAPQQQQHQHHQQQQQQQQQQHHHQQQQQQHQHQMQTQMMAAQTPVSSSGPQPSPVHAQEAFRQPPTPGYYSPHPHTPQQSPFPYSTGPPSQGTPLSAGGPMSGRPQMSPASTGPMPPLSAPPVQSPHAYQSRFAPFQTHGPVMSNIHNPNGQPMLVGALPHGMMQGFNSGHAANIQMYSQTPQTPQSTPQNDRPFKCDQCPQSFNRNHDLKRHKRIHLAVKPFPCGHCDKSFSRKDALKRHVLVKGCGKAKAEADAAKAEAVQCSLSPIDKPATSEDGDSKTAILQ